MKNKIILGAMLMVACAFSMEVNAQLEVVTSGDVNVSKNLNVADTLTVGENLRAINDVTVHNNLTVNQNVAIGTNIDDHTLLNLEYLCPAESTPSTYYGIKSHIKPPYATPTSSVYGVYGWADATSLTYIVPNLPMVGVMGVAVKSYSAPTSFAAGVVGTTHYYGGIGVYGSITSSPTTAPSSMASGEAYAGYFSGTVKVNGTIIATAVSTTSDERQKENIQEISSSLSDNLNLLRPVSYTLKQDSAWIYDKNAKELQGTHYGLLAQEVQEIFPELVYERGEQLSINYIELIPLLILKVQELSAEVEELKASPKAKTLSSKKNTSNEETIEAILYQNNPNPFTADTKIEYQLPLSTQSATLYVYDMNGLQKAEYPILSFGEGSVVVSAGVLDAGMYLYSLIVDGQVVDTKRMILTK